MEVPRDEHERTIAFADIAMGQIKNTVIPTVQAGCVAGGGN